MGEGEISPFIYLRPGGILKYDREELETIQLVLQCGRAQPSGGGLPPSLISSRRDQLVMLMFQIDHRQIDDRYISSNIMVITNKSLEDKCINIDQEL